MLPLFFSLSLALYLEEKTRESQCKIKTKTLSEILSASKSEVNFLHNSHLNTINTKTES